MSRTMIVSYIMAAVGFLGLIGVDLPADTIETLLNSVTDDALELFMIISAGIMGFLRTITSSPLVKGVGGLLGKKE